MAQAGPQVEVTKGIFWLFLVKTLQVLSLEVDGLLLEVKSLWLLGMGDGLGNLHDSEKQGF